ncbi:hypothetical protein CRG98_039269 [Punica granatum]|uniref:Uncharacterized protein n=1 Tax=Punica granatum TaxID=22663 RepID=A0A2I0I9J1_PUNGR|nr:hypothetical protein CRG98_039269 [Punica granatum]
MARGSQEGLSATSLGVRPRGSFGLLEPTRVDQPSARDHLVTRESEGHEGPLEGGGMTRHACCVSCKPAGQAPVHPTIHRATHPCILQPAGQTPVHPAIHRAMLPCILHNIPIHPKQEEEDGHWRCHVDHYDQTGVLLKVFGYILYSSKQSKRGKLSTPYFGPPVRARPINSNPDYDLSIDAEESLTE